MLNYTDDEVWHLTPRQYKAQIAEYVKYHSDKANAFSDQLSDLTDGYIDEIPGL